MTNSFVHHVPKQISLSGVHLFIFLLLVISTLPVFAQRRESFPIDLIPGAYRSQVQEIIEQSDFQFQTLTAPKKIEASFMEMLFDHPRISAVMWRHCQFTPSFFAFEESFNTFFIDDTKGLTGRLILLYSEPGHRIYWVQGTAEAGRLKPFAPAVSATMITSYRYWETNNGFEAQLDTWTKVDNALLGFLAQPFRKYVQRRQEEFIDYINNNIALFGATIKLNSEEYHNLELILEDPKIKKDISLLYPVSLKKRSSNSIR
jgi:hypothetical protein